MVTLWQELDQCYDDVWDNPNDCARHMKKEENDWVYMFLTSINHNLNEIKEQILGQKPLSSIHEVFSKVKQEECKKRIKIFGCTIFIHNHGKKGVFSWILHQIRNGTNVRTQFQKKKILLPWMFLFLKINCFLLLIFK